MKIYISGKITGLNLKEAKKNFEEIEKLVNDLGHKPVNPMKHVKYDPKLTWEDYILADIRLLFGCDCIFMQENWKDSRGARIERLIAIEMDMKIKHLPLSKEKHTEFMES